MLTGLKLVISVLVLLVILSGCSAKPQILLPPAKQVEVPKPKVSPELKSYCIEPLSIPDELQISDIDKADVAQQKLRQVMNIVTMNHETYAICYIRQNGLVDAVNSIEKGQ